MKHISSRDNPLYKDLKRLATSPAARQRASQTLLDGIHLCEMYLSRRGQPLHCIVAESALAHAEVAALLERVDSQCVQVLADALFAALAQVEHGVRLLFVIAVPKEAASSTPQQPCVLLDRLQDPGNLGSILRSAAAAGVTHVYCAAGTVAAWSPKVLRAAMGAHFVLTIHEDCDLQALLSSLTTPVYAMSSHAEHSLYDCDVVTASWVFGNEGQGVATTLLTSGIQTLRIPQPGGMESLNVAAAAAVCLFEQVRQRSGGR